VDKGAKMTALSSRREPVPAYRPPQRHQATHTTLQQSAGSGAMLHHAPVQSDRCAQVEADRDAWEKSVGCEELSIRFAVGRIRSTLLASDHP
jgi:hypothetical protein